MSFFPRPAMSSSTDQPPEQHSTLRARTFQPKEGAPQIVFFVYYYFVLFCSILQQYELLVFSHMRCFFFTRLVLIYFRQRDVMYTQSSYNLEQGAGHLCDGIGHLARQNKLRSTTTVPRRRWEIFFVVESETARLPKGSFPLCLPSCR